MAFRASSVLPTIAYQNIKRQALNVKTTAQEARTAADSAVGADRVLAMLNQMVGYKTSLAQQASVPGLAEFAKGQEDDPAYDVQAEYLALKAAIEAVIDEVDLTFPWSTFRTSRTAYQQFSAASLANLRTKLDVLIAVIS